MTAYTPKTGARCSCKRGIQRDNCPTCEGTGQAINFAAIRARKADAPAWASAARFLSAAFTPEQLQEARDCAARL